ncbi:hypothetical protein EGH90_00340 [Kaistella haifensis]|nr:hypothetical protein EGH90_00340 [Kaistella haifensis]
MNSKNDWIIPRKINSLLDSQNEKIADNKMSKIPSKNRGGRPQKNLKRTKQLNLIFTNSEYDAILKKANLLGLKPTTFCYFLIEGKDLTQIERLKTLTQYATNFTRISNYMKMGIFNSYEKERLINEISEVINKIKIELK